MKFKNGQFNAPFLRKEVQMMMIAVVLQKEAFQVACLAFPASSVAFQGACLAFPAASSLAAFEEASCQVAFVVALGRTTSTASSAVLFLAKIWE